MSVTETNNSNCISTDDKLNNISIELFNKKNKDCSMEQKNITFITYLKKYALPCTKPTRKITK
tara:strand:+ start:302 stop:490 length:189 start_codon:yes stop_codon:yes gene_type:complete